MGVACLLQTCDHERKKKTRVEARGSNQVHAKRIFVCFLLGKTVRLVTEKFLHREKGWFWKLKKKKKMIPHFLGQEMSSQLKISLGKPVVLLQLVFALGDLLQQEHKLERTKIRSVSNDSGSLGLTGPLRVPLREGPFISLGLLLLSWAASA